MTKSKLNAKGAYIVAFLAMFAVAFIASFGASQANAAYNANEGSFYKTASAARTFYEVMVNGGKVTKADIFENAPSDAQKNVGNFAALMGFPDADVIANPQGTLKGAGSDADSWLSTSSGTSKNTDTISYNANASDDLAAEMITQYGVYAMTLQRLGMDSTTGENQTHGERIATGNTLHGLYYITKSIDDVMKFSVTALQRINPFGLFIGVNNPTGMTESEDDKVNGTLTGEDPFEFFEVGLQGENIDVEGELTAGTGKGESGSLFAQNASDGPIATIRNWWQELYRGLYGMSMFILFPLMLAFAIVSYLITHSSGRNSYLDKGSTTRFMNYFKRVAFVVFGIPLMGSLYTAFLNKAADIAGGNEFDSYSADRLILSTLVDFEGWAKESALAPYDGVYIEGSANGATAQSYYHLRESVYKINSTVGEKLYGYGLGDYTRGDRSTTSLVVAENENAGLSVDDLQMVWADKSGESTSESNTDISDYANKLLNDYASGATFTGEDYEGWWRQRYTEKAADSGTAAEALANLSQWLIATGDPAVYATNLASLRYDTTASKLTDVDATGVAFGVREVGRLLPTASYGSDAAIIDAIEKAYAEGKTSEEIAKLIEELKEAEATVNYGHETVTITDFQAPLGSGGLKTTHNNAAKDADNATIYQYSTGNGAGFTPIGMYNYLNTVFKSGGMTVYSASRSVNTQSRTAHYSVNFVGGGIIGVALYVNTFLLLLAIAITGIVYGFGMLFSNAKRSVMMLLSTPLAMLGGLRAIAHVLLLGLALVAELIGSYGAYMIMRSVLVIINQVIVDNTVTTAISTAASEAAKKTAEQSGTILMGGLATSPTMALALTFLLSIIVSCVLFVVYIILAINLRHALVGAIDDAISAVLSRVVGVSAGDYGASVGSGGGFMRGLMMTMAGGSAAAGNMVKLGGFGIGTAALVSNDANQVSDSQRDGDIENTNVDTQSQTTDYDQSSQMARESYASTGGIENESRQDGSAGTARVYGNMEGDFGDSSMSSIRANTAEVGSVSPAGLSTSTASAETGSSLANAVAMSDSNANAQGSETSANAVGASAPVGLSTATATATGGNAGTVNAVGGAGGNANAEGGAAGNGGDAGDALATGGDAGDGHAQARNVATTGDLSMATLNTANATSVGGNGGDANSNLDYAGNTSMHNVNPASFQPGVAGKDGTPGEGGAGAEAFVLGGEGGKGDSRGVDISNTLSGGQVAGGSMYSNSYDRDVELTSAGQHNVAAPSLSETLAQSGAPSANVAVDTNSQNVNLGNTLGTGNGVYGVTVSGQPGQGGQGGIGGQGEGGTGGRGEGGTGGYGGTGGRGQGQEVRGISASGATQHSLGEVTAANANVGYGHSEHSETGSTSERDGVRGVRTPLSDTMGLTHGVAAGTVVSGGGGNGIESGRSGGFTSSISDEVKGARAQGSSGIGAAGTGGTSLYGDRDGKPALKDASKSARMSERKRALTAQQQAARDRFAKRGGASAHEADLGEVFNDGGMEGERSEFGIEQSSI